MFHTSGKQCVATLVVGTVSKVQVMLQLSSTCFDVNVSLNETSFALVLARGGPPFLFSEPKALSESFEVWEKYPLRVQILKIQPSQSSPAGINDLMGMVLGQNSPLLAAIRA
jgi:hypothetical protein